MAKTKIEWTAGEDGSMGETWNPTVGCTRVSEGCRNCYAFALHDTRHAAYKNGKKLPLQYAKPFKELQLKEDRIDLPLRWKRPRKVFVNSMSDLFHKDIPDDFIDRVFAVMAMCPQHTFQILTKRPERMRDYCRQVIDDDKDLQRFAGPAAELAKSPCAAGIFDDIEYPFPNVWLGTSIEDQQRADERQSILEVPAAKLFLSVEPLLGPVDLSKYLQKAHVDWVICGGESGPGARPMHPDWARSIRDQCQATGTPFFFKQHGDWYPFYDRDKDDPDWRNVPQKSDTVRMINAAGGSGFHGDRVVYFKRIGKKTAGRMLDGREWSEYP